ncbi:NUDIX domain-containing protein [Xylanimonas sp. McL0601]|uniref:NUDIX domain-containing protein n=1 Tax=Xylanimonas sp. McL0601 TaxID=3414739 RepID=UPI003CF61BC7
MSTTSAGLLLFRRTDGGPEVLLGHMGGPFWASKNAGAWTIPKGELGPGEDPHDAALREAGEELGLALPPPVRPGTPDVDLGEIRQRAGKRVLAWAREIPRDALDLSNFRSNTFEIEWPPHSGRQLEIPELDRAAWFTPPHARELVIQAQSTFIERLEASLGTEVRRTPTGP